MPEVSYVYPNLSIFHRNKNSIRGGLTERWNQAQKSNCECIEVPATLIKNKTEERLTSRDIGEFLSDTDISLLYNQEDTIPEGLKYILHTEPSLSKENRFGSRIQPPIKWFDNEWVARYIEMLLSITDYLNYPASVIEIHPGYRDNSYEDIARYIGKFLNIYYSQRAQMFARCTNFHGGMHA